MLYVLDEPSVGLHPSNVEGLRTTIDALTANGNSVVIVEHDIELIRSADWIIELGSGAGEHGGSIVAEGTPDGLQADVRSIIGPFLSGARSVRRDRPAPPSADGQIVIAVSALYNLRHVTAAFPVHGLSALAGPSGAGKTALVLDSLVPAVRAPSTDVHCPSTSVRSSLGASATSSASTPPRSATTRGRRPVPPRYQPHLPHMSRCAVQ